MKNSAYSRLMVAIFATLSSIIGDYRHRTGLRRTARRWLFVSVLLFLNCCNWVEFVSPTSVRETADAAAAIAIVGLFMAVAWSALAAVIRQPWAQAAVHDLRTSERYRSCGPQSLLVAVMITGAAYSAINLDFMSYVHLLNETPFVLVRDIAFTLGSALAMALGIVGLVRPSWAGRVVGAIGFVAGLNVWILEHRFGTLWGRLTAIAGTLRDDYIGIPVSTVYDLAGGNPVAGAAIIAGGTLVTYVLARRWVVRHGWRGVLGLMRV